MTNLQDNFAPKSICFGCGPANKEGLQIKSVVNGDTVVCEWTPKPHHHAFPGVVNGGIIGCLLDCHCNWTAAWGIRQKTQSPEIPCTVTAEYTIKLLRPTPMGTPVKMKAKIASFEGNDRAWVEGELIAAGKTTATCRGLFVAVKAGHPAFHRW